MRQYAALAALATTGAVLGADRLSATEKGSLLIYSGAQGTIHISNDYPADVRLQSYIVNDACESYDMAFSLTANQITAFSTQSLDAPFGDGGTPLRFRCTSGLSVLTTLKSVGTTSPVASSVPVRTLRPRPCKATTVMPSVSLVP